MLVKKPLMLRAGRLLIVGLVWRIIMPVIIDVEKSGGKELDGGFRVSGRDVNLWIRVYDTEYGRRVRLTISYNDGYRWINTPPLWMDRSLLEEFIMRLNKLSNTLR